ncbi:hypothetical protein PC129_g25110 [Phytophthora cactorum]|uniref:Ankyrin repeat-containing domain n=2 Tax=Phytophthora cactorum TaxID=29920 RepID=A0A8T1J2E4_9STRA|nr:hypothetical protein PC113_g25758 [Phytophthora cactorum]KAG3003812.1 hypothetical protein PC121_g25536 [Phytophthora cactorum]KAG3190785.1 hypothetical protein PC129_g25110 [Phytophthora cactorum]KAG4029449.1 hypothetical protein PC123_g29054 [Phytophthora cactorum]KAG4217570.1 hypothetical protein PC116_g33950 [Phytophthora cactorum]
MAASIFRTTLVTPLHCAVSTGQIQAVQWLIEHGVNVNLKSKASYWSDRMLPLFVADNPDIVTLLLEAGANHLEVPDPGHMNTLTVLQMAYMRTNWKNGVLMWRSRLYMKLRRRTTQQLSGNFLRLAQIRTVWANTVIQACTAVHHYTGQR